MLKKNDYLSSVYFRRRSIRKFTSQEIDQEIIQALAHGFFQTESAKNQVPGELIIITDKKTIQSIADTHNSKPIIVQAPLLLAVVAKENYRLLPTAFFIDQDLGAATHQVLLMAEDFGLGGLWCGIRENVNEAMSKILGVPSSARIISLICIGYKNEVKEPNQKNYPEKIHYEKW